MWEFTEKPIAGVAPNGKRGSIRAGSLPLINRQPLAVKQRWDGFFTRVKSPGGEGLSVRKTQRNLIWDGLPGKPRKKGHVVTLKLMCRNQSPSVFLCRAKSFSCTRWGPRSHFCRRQFPPLPGNREVSICCSEISTQIESERGKCNAVKSGVLYEKKQGGSASNQPFPLFTYRNRCTRFHLCLHFSVSLPLCWWVPAVTFDLGLR